MFRSSEKLIEHRTPELNNGYFARLDYVSHLFLELSYTGYLQKSSLDSTVLLNENLSANHLLNISCTLADSGMVSAILWTFEVRELFAERLEVLYGVRLHCNVSILGNFYYTFSVWTINNVSMCYFTVIKIASTRLFCNSMFRYSDFLTCFISSCMSSSSGIIDTMQLNIDTSWNLITTFYGYKYSCSLTRHILRCVIGVASNTTCIKMS